MMRGGSASYLKGVYGNCCGRVELVGEPARLGASTLWAVWGMCPLLPLPVPPTLCTPMHSYHLL